MIKSNEYNELKIAYAKLQEDNMNNKMIIEEILGIDSDEPITSQELREKIENKQRPEPITRQENWNDYMCFLLERILMQKFQYH